MSGLVGYGSRRPDPATTSRHPSGTRDRPSTVSYLMDYGPDWPPPPEPPKPRQPSLWRTLVRQCALWTLVYVVIAVGAVVAVRLLVPPFYPESAPPAASSSTPHPATTHSHP